MNFIEKKFWGNKTIVKKIAHACGCGFGTCLKFYAFFAIPQVWFWFPAFAIEKLIRG